MRHARLSALLLGAIVSTGCFQMTTVVHLNGDGSGTIDHSLVITKAALTQLRQLSMLAGGRGQSLDFVSEEQARRMAATLGEGVTYVSSEAINTAIGEGRTSRYAFTDINNLRISPQPDTGGLKIKTQAFSTDANAITCAFTRDPGGSAVLTINLPELNLQSALGNANTGDAGVAQQLAMMRSLLAGARVLIGVEPAGRLVRTTSPFVDGTQVTLLDINLDQVLANETLIAQVQAAKTPEETTAALLSVPGLRMVLDRQVTIEFTPAK